MAVRTDEAQLEISFITDESRALARALVDTKKLQVEINRANKETAEYEKQLKQTNISEQKRSEILKNIADRQKIVADGTKKILDIAKPLQGLDLSKMMPQQLIDRGKQLEQIMKRLPANSPEFAKLQAELAAINTTLRDIRQTSQGLTSESNGGLLAGFSTRAIGLLGGVGAAFTALKQAVTGASELEQLTISFEVFLGSAEKAKEVIKDLKDFEVKTPFEAQQVNAAGRALLAFGFSTQELIPTLTRVGDVAAGTGKDFNELALIYGKAKAQGLIQGEELNQLAEAGIPIYAELAKVLGVNESQIRKLGEQGKIQFSDLEQVFKNLTSEGGRFSGLMERQSQSIGGLYSTLKSAFENLLTDLGTSLLPALKNISNGLLSLVEFAKAELIPTFKLAGETISFATGLLSDFFSFLNANKLGEAGRLIKLALVGPFGLVGDAIKKLKGAFTGGTEEIKQEAENVSAEAEAEAAKRQQEKEKENEEKNKKLQAELAKKEADERKKRVEAAFQAQLAKAEADEKREELIQQNRFVRNTISEEQLQARLSQIQEEGLRNRLAVYERFGRDEQNAALELKNQLAAIETGRATRAADTPVATLGPRGGLGPVASTGDNTAQTLGVAGIGNDAARVALRQKFEAALITEQDYQLKSLELKRAFIEEELAILRAATEPNVKEIEKREDAKLKVEEDIAKKRADNEARLQEYKNRIQEAGFETFQEAVNLGIELLSKDEKARKKYASVIKTFEIGVVTAQGISEVQKIYAKNASLPGGALLSLVEAAPAILRTTAAIVKIERQKFAGGGYTGPGYGMPDSTGFRPAGVVHEDEYVSPKWMVQHPKVAPVISWLERVRTRGFAEGGLVTVNTTPTLPQSAVSGISVGSESGAIIEAAMLIRQAAASIPRRVQASVNYLDIEDAGSEINTIRNEAGF